jgi:glutamate carboxypeptidase
LPELAERIRESVRHQHFEIIASLKQLVEVNSHSRNYDGINRVGDMVARFMPGILHRRIITDRNSVKHLIFAGSELNGKPVVLIGHTDTVFPPDSKFQNFMEVGDRIHGPGTSDMKGGIVVMVFALRVLDELGLLGTIPIRCLVNGDEEIGSPHSLPMIKEVARDASFGLVFECGGLEGEVVYARRGIRRFKLTVTGKARHAGVKEGPKDSAIVELSRMILALEDLNDPEKGVSINVGKISGGTDTNVVPDNATALFEFRFWDGETERAVLDRIGKIVNNPDNPQCTAKYKCDHQRPAGCPVEGTDELFSLVKNAAKDLQQTLGKERRGGTSDANFLTNMGIPTLDGLGPVGDLDHSPEEYILKQSLFERIELTALVLARLGGQASDQSSATEPRGKRRL